jgi:hypothetical protein
MSIVTETPPDSETEVIVSVDEGTPALTEEVEPAAVDEAEVNEDAPSTESVEAASNNNSEPPVQKLYRHDCDYSSCPSRWSKYAVHQEEQDALEAEVSHMPIVQRNVFSQDKGWETTSFTINSPDMRAFLSDALANYQDLDPDLEGWSFSPPYKALVHRWDRLQGLHKELQQSEEGHEKKKAVDQLVEFLQPILAPSVEDLAATRETGKIRYDMIWQIFPPGEIVLTKFWGVETVCRVVKYRKSEPGDRPVCWYIKVEYVDWDGERCGLQRTEIKVHYYQGFTRVTSLPVYPLAFTEHPEEIKEAMMARGRRFQELRGYHFLSYNGVKVSMGEKWEEEPVSPSAERGLVCNIADRFAGDRAGHY